MKIAVLSAAESIHTIRWANALDAAGHTVLLCSLPDQKAPPGVLSAGVAVRYLKRGGARGYWLGGGELRGILRDFGPDVLSAHYATGYGTLARRSGFHPTMLSVWGSDVYDFPKQGFLHRIILNRNLRFADVIASTSHVMARQTERCCGLRGEIEITPFGVDTGIFYPRNTEKLPGITIGIVKTLEPKYGVEYLIRAFSLLLLRMERENTLPQGGLNLLIYGSGSEKDRLAKLAEKLGILKQTRFMGAIPHEQVPAALSSLDIFCATSVEDSESFGVAAVEAMACAVPVVASDVDGFREVLKDGETGFIVGRRDPEATAGRLYDLCRNETLRIRMGQAGRKHVLEQYEWRDCVRRMEQALEKTAGKASGGPLNLPKGARGL